MNLEERINAFSELGKSLIDIPIQVFLNAENQNPWFTVENQKQAINSWANKLTKENINAWLNPYQITGRSSSQNVLIIMAGNIPLVGFHDFLGVLITGNKATVKMSSNDSVLLPFIFDMLVKIEKRFSGFINFVEGVQGQKFHAIIATGSDQSAQYFEYYFLELVGNIAISVILK